MPMPVLRTYGKRSSTSSDAALKRKSTSELTNDDAPSTTGTSIPKPTEKRRKLETSPTPSLPRPSRVDNLQSSTVSRDASPSRSTSLTKLSKRMLGRSKTESSVTDDTNDPPTRDTRQTPSLSLPILPISPSKEKPQRSTLIPPLRTSSSSGLASSSINLTSTNSTTISTTRPTITRTYAGKSRSFLMPLSSFPSDGSAPEFSQNDQVEDEFTRESYSSLRQRWGVDDTSEDDPFYDTLPTTSYHGRRSNTGTPTSATPSPSKSNNRGKGRAGSALGTPTRSRSRKDGASPTKHQLPLPPPLPSNMMNPLKSITELRNKGESRRFLDEVAYLLDGMVIPRSGGLSKATPNLGLVRASALELINKLSSSADFSRKAKAADIYGKVYDLLLDAGAGQGTDKVLDTLLLTYLALLARESASLRELGEMYPARSAPPTPPSSRNSAKGKGKPTSTLCTPSRSLIDILFNLLQLYTPGDTEQVDGPPLPTDPLVLASRDTYSDAHFKRAGIGKKERGMVSTLYTILTSRPLPGTGAKDAKRTSLDTPTLVVSLLNVLPHSLFPGDKWRVEILIKSLNSLLQPIGSPKRTLKGEGSSKRKSRPISALGNLHIHLCLLDLYLLGQWSLQTTGEEEEDSSSAPDGDEAWVVMVDGLIRLGEMIVGRIAESEGDEDGVLAGLGGAEHCLEALLRVLVTLTHGEATWATRVAHHKGNSQGLAWLASVVKGSGEQVGVGSKEKEKMKRQVKNGDGTRRKRKLEEDGEETETEAVDTEIEESGHADQQQRVEQRARALDRLCLALALLTNLVQVVEDVGDLMRDSGMFEVLVGVYRQQGGLSEELGSVLDSDADAEGNQEREQAVADASFLRGHLAVLFGLLMEGDEENQDRLLRLLPTRGESHRIKVACLVEQARMFLCLFEVVQSTQQQEGLSDEEKSEKKVAQQVVAFLEALRDKS